MFPSARFIVFGLASFFTIFTFLTTHYFLPGNVPQVQDLPDHNPDADQQAEPVNNSVDDSVDDSIDNSVDNSVDNSIDWSHFAYVQYVTTKAYLCNSVMLFESLTFLGVKADKVMLYPEEYSIEGENPESTLLRKARDEYNVILKPIQIQRKEQDDRSSPSLSFSPHLAFRTIH